MMPHLKPNEPLPEFAGNHIVGKKGYLPIEWWNWRDPRHSLFNLPTTLQWCQPIHWIDDASETIVGGHLGVKWAVVVLGYLRRNIHRYQSDIKSWSNHYSRAQGDLQEDILFVFEEGDIRRVNGAIKDLRKALTRSKARLMAFEEYRVERRPDELVLASSARSHLNLPMHSSQFHTVSSIPSLAEWHVSRGAMFLYKSNSQFTLVG
jgi:hypothetical protein